LDGEAYHAGERIMIVGWISCRIFVSRNNFSRREKDVSLKLTISGSNGKGDAIGLHACKGSLGGVASMISLLDTPSKREGR
jgi:hypothetical protein